MDGRGSEHRLSLDGRTTLLDALRDTMHLAGTKSEDRRFNPLGVKGLAEIGICGVAPVPITLKELWG